MSGCNDNVNYSINNGIDINILAYSLLTTTALGFSSYYIMKYFFNKKDLFKLFEYNNDDGKYPLECKKKYVIEYSNDSDSDDISNIDNESNSDTTSYITSESCSCDSCICYSNKEIDIKEIDDKEDDINITEYSEVKEDDIKEDDIKENDIKEDDIKENDIKENDIK
jgi:hypothetical protein